MAHKSQWKSVDNLPNAVGYGNAVIQPQITPPDDSLPARKPVLWPRNDDDNEDELDFDVSRRRIAAGIEEIRNWKNRHVNLVVPRVSRVLNAFSDTEIVNVAYNAISTPIKEWLDEEELEWDAGIMTGRRSEKSWETSDPGVYLWEIGHISRLYRPVRYSGAAWGLGGLNFRCMQHESELYRRRSLTKKRSYIYEYREGLYGERLGSRFVAFATFQRGNLTPVDCEGWALILETLSMILLQTLSEQNDNSLPTYRAMYLEDMGTSKYLGGNRTISIRQYNGQSREVGGSSADLVLAKLEGLIRVWNKQGTAMKRIQRELIIFPRQQHHHKTPIVLITGSFKLGIALPYLEVLGLHIGDRVTITLDIVEDGLHPHPWIEVDDDIEEALEAKKLGICISSISRNPQSQHFGNQHSLWIKRQMNSFQKGVLGHPRCNAAMSIIEWMRGEEVVPVPRNRIIISDGNARHSNYYGIAADSGDTGMKRKHHEALAGSVSGQEALQQFEEFKSKKPRRG